MGVSVDVGGAEEGVGRGRVQGGSVLGGRVLGGGVQGGRVTGGRVGPVTGGRGFVVRRPSPGGVL